MRDTVVVLSSQEMGLGDAALGKMLMKSFLYALKEQSEVISAVLCYNGGALLASDQSEVLEDLRALEAEGIPVLVCGTCAEFYHIKDVLAVGKVTNMFDIVERMSGAARIVRP